MEWNLSREWHEFEKKVLQHIQPSFVHLSKFPNVFVKIYIFCHSKTWVWKESSSICSFPFLPPPLSKWGANLISSCSAFQKQACKAILQSLTKLEISRKKLHLRWGRMNGWCEVENKPIAREDAADYLLHLEWSNVKLTENQPNN